MSSPLRLRRTPPTCKHLGVLAFTAAVTLVAASCSGSVVHNYRTFQSALDRGASCTELFDQRSRFSDEATLAKVDRDLDRIGCATRGSVRTDR